MLQLTSRSSEPEMRKLLQEITFVIVPCANPDGYEFTRSSTNPHVGPARKFLNQWITVDSAVAQESIGDDLPQ